MAKLIRSTSREISSIGLIIQQIVEKINTLISFRRVIEQEPTVNHIYQRLSRFLKHKFNLKKLVIFEISNSVNQMIPVPTLGKEYLNVKCPKDPSLCQCVRTSMPATTFDLNEMCPFFEENIVAICLPLQVEGRAISVIKIYLDKEKITDYMQLKEFISNIQPYLEVAAGIVALKRYAEDMQKTALYDYLTGFYNRHVLEDCLKRSEALARRQKTGVGILMLDLDHFKRINDTYGHNAGDAVLRQVAFIIKKIIRSSDLPIRYGGEEFLLILNDIVEGSLNEIAERIRKTIEANTFTWRDISIHITVSIGGAIFPKDADNLMQLIEIADLALYEAKQTGRNKVVIKS